MNRPELLKKIILETTTVDVMTKSQKRDIVDARKIYAQILYDNGYGLTQIGRTINKNHATVLHYLKDSEILLLMDKHYKDNYDKILTAYERKFSNALVNVMTRVELENEVERLREENHELKLRFLDHIKNRQ